MSDIKKGRLLSAILPRLHLVKGPDGKGNYTVWCVFHDDGNGKPPHQPNLRVSERGFVCFACGEKGSLVKLARHLDIPTHEDEPESTFDYRDDNGHLLFQVVRYRGKQFFQRRPNGKGGWIWNLKGVRRVLYHLPELLERIDERVFLVEGEKDVETLMARGLLATTNPGGAGKWRPEYSQLLSGRDVVILPDNDPPGKLHANRVANELLGIANSVKVIELPGSDKKGDIRNWLAAGHTIEELLELTDRAKPISAPIELPQETMSRPAGKKTGSQADRLVNLVLNGEIILFRDQMGECFARFAVDGHNEIWPAGSRQFKRYLAQRFYREEEKVPSNDAIRNAINVIEGELIARGVKHNLCNRVAVHDGAFWYDLTDAGWRAIKITPRGWNLVDDPPILFKRFAHQSPQVEPVSGKNLQDIFSFLNISNDAHRILVLVYLVTSFIPHICHHICVLYGAQGSAKTTAFRLLRQLIDPSICEILAFPKDEGQLVQALSHNWAAYFDNLSGLQSWASDALCRAVTGEGYSKRQLYSNDDDYIYSFRCCVGLNGVNIVAKKPDLLDRCLLFGLDPIKADQRKTEEDLFIEFRRAKPYLLGAIFDALSKAMANYDHVRLERSARMADFNRWGVAIAEALGYQREDFLYAYDESLHEQSQEVLQGNPVAAAILKVMENETEWKGSASELLKKLNDIAESLKLDNNSKQWPRAANTLTRRLNEVTQNLLTEGISVVQWRNERGKQFWISKNPEECQRLIKFPENSTES